MAINGFFHYFRRSHFPKCPGRFIQFPGEESRCSNCKKTEQEAEKQEKEMKDAKLKETHTGETILGFDCDVK